MARWQKPEPLVPYIDTFGFDLPKSAPLSTSDPWTSSVPSVPWEASSPMAIRESMPSAVSPSLFETTDIEELRETIMREEKEKAAEAYAQKEQELQEKMNALKEQHRLRCDELLRQKEKEIQDILREERLQSQEQIQKATDLWARKGQKLQEELGAKEAEIAALKEEGQFQLEKLLSQQQEQEERLQIQEKAAEARATEKKLQEQLIEKDVLIDALKEENRMQCEEAVRKQEEMQEALQEERFHNQELREMILLEEKEKTAHAIALKEKDLQERLAEKDSELDTLRKERRIRDELLSCKDQEMEDVIREERLQQQELRELIAAEEREKAAQVIFDKEKDFQELREVIAAEEREKAAQVIFDKEKDFQELREVIAAEEREKAAQVIFEKEKDFQELREVIAAEEREKAAQVLLEKEKDFQERVRGKDLELEALRDQRQLQEELVCRKDQEVQGLLEEERRQEEDLQAAHEEIQRLKAEQQSLNEMVTSREEEFHTILAEEHQEKEELRAEMDRLKEQNQAACQEKEARLELEMAELADQKGSLDAQIAALIQRLDEEQAERIRQGARAESLEKDLEALRGRHLEEKELRRGREGQASWWRFTQRLSAEAEVAALRTSQRSLRSEVVMLRAGKAQDQAQVANLAMSVEENEKLLAANLELSNSLQHFKQENEQLQIDNRSLLESVALFEGDLEKVSDRHAQLIGHVNKKQKIRYTVKLKEECAQLRAELSKARHRLNQLEGHRRQDGLMSALASLGYETPALSFTGKADRAGGTSRRLQEGTLQRLDADFRHLVCLVQSALGEDGRSDLPFAQLLQALREVQQAKAEAKASAPASAARHEGAMASPVRVLATSPAKAFASPSKSTATVSPSSLRSPKVSPVKEKRASLFEDQENLEANCHTREPLLGEAQKALAKINQCIGSGRKLYGQPVSDSYAFFQVLQRKGALERKDVAQGLKRLDITLGATSFDALIHALENGYLGAEAQ